MLRQPAGTQDDLGKSWHSRNRPKPCQVSVSTTHGPFFLSHTQSDFLFVRVSLGLL